MPNLSFSLTSVVTLWRLLPCYLTMKPPHEVLWRTVKPPRASSLGGRQRSARPHLACAGARPNAAIDLGVPQRVLHLPIGLEGADAHWGDPAAAMAAAA